MVLHLAGRYLGSPFADSISFDDYRHALDSDPRNIRAMELDPDDPEAEAERTVVMLTWELSLDSLSRRGLPHARPLLRLLSCYASPLPIPLSLLNGQLLIPLLGLTDDITDSPDAITKSIAQALRGLDQVGLISAMAGCLYCQ